MLLKIRTLSRNFITERSKSLREHKITLLRDYFKPGNLILDVGVWCDPEPNSSDNWMEKHHHADVQIIAVGLDNMQLFHNKYPDVLCVQADGSALPIKNNAFEAALSNAVLEHVAQGSQLRFVEEISRVVQKRAVIAVPDRVSPLEIHSRIFFLHWFPGWRQLFRCVGERFWSLEENLSTIFTKKKLLELLQKSSVNGHWKIKRQFLLFLPVSLIAIFSKGSND